MLRNYLKIAFRNLIKNPGYSAINIGGLAVGMAVAVLIGLWVYDEISFDKYHKNYDRIAGVWQHVSFGPEKSTYGIGPIPLANELRTKYPDFESAVVTKGQYFVLTSGDKKLSKPGYSVEPQFLDMMSVRILSGTKQGLNEVNSIMLSQSLAEVFFGTESPINKLVKIDNGLTVKVTGVYEDFPNNSSFYDVQFLTPWDFALAKEDYIRQSANEWDNNSFQIYGQLKAGTDFDKVSDKIKDIRVKRNDPPGYRPEFFLHPMGKWHLLNDFKNGVSIGGLMKFVWLFGVIGIFVLLLACINFMNLSTARSEKRAKEVGIRKAVGSMRGQLVSQFFSESLLVVAFSFVISILLAAVCLPFFNEVAGKKIVIPWLNPLFWAIGILFSLVTGLVAGSYPALYLSSFHPLKVLKGTFSVGRFAAIPRKVLVVMQFTVSVTLIIGTIIVFRQIQYAKNIPVGYDRNGLIEMKLNTNDLVTHYDALRRDLINTGTVSEIGEASGHVTSQDGGTTNTFWEGKDPGSKPLLMKNAVTQDYGKAIGWKLNEGRDFSRAFSTDTSAMILNESALKLIGFGKPLESFVTYNGKKYHVIGVIDDMVKENPFSPVNPSFYIMNYNELSVLAIKLSPQMSASDALARVESVVQKYSPATPFEYKFVNEEYNTKFGTEERIGKLASFFAVLAVLISCLGLFGLASFVAEQRTKEIGIRKVLGASVANLWQMLSKDFVLLVSISCLISVPVAWYFMSDWLKSYKYHAEMSWGIFAMTAGGALLITLLTVSYQAIRAALTDPVKSLRSE
jgi:putative ABC transport system permease protein